MCKHIHCSRSFRSGRGRVKAMLTHSFLNTSIKGIPRAVRADRRTSRVLWTVFTLGFISVSAFQSVGIASYYLKFEYHTFSSQVSTKSGSGTPHPSVTICNLNCFAGNASRTIKDLGLMDLGTYERMIETITACKGCSEEDSSFLQRLRKDLLTPHGYFTSIGKENAWRLGQLRDEFIIGCYLHKADAYRSHFKECRSGLVEVNTHFDPDYFLCHTITPINSDSLHGITLILHLDDFFSEQYDHLDLVYEQGKYLGAVLSLHEQGKFPVMRQKSVHLPPGYFTDIKIESREKERLPWPYSNCTGDEYTPGTNWKYTSGHCISSCMEAKIITGCLCKDTYLLNILDTMDHDHLPYCIDPAHGQQAMLEKTKCAWYIRNNQMGECIAKCPISCDDIHFEPISSTALWPPNPFHDEFYESHIAGRPYEWRYANLSRVVFEENNPGASPRSEIRGLVSRNFLRVDISFNEVIFTKDQDIPKTTFTQFLSLLGGMLNIFGGISIFVSVELVDLLITLCFTRKTLDVHELQPT